MGPTSGPPPWTDGTKVGPTAMGPTNQLYMGLTLIFLNKILHTIMKDFFHDAML